MNLSKGCVLTTGSGWLAADGPTGEGEPAATERSAMPGRERLSPRILLEQLRERCLRLLERLECLAVDLKRPFDPALKKR